MKTIEKYKKRILVSIGMVIGSLILVISLEYGRAYTISNKINNIISDEIKIINTDNQNEAYHGISEGAIDVCFKCRYLGRR